ncbi:hypothetical protein [Limnobacter sp.]|uniref:hypothetical protein n=1 Tax=Limnobacter sp. TaxID=2003368 RepID=UPI003513A43C
MAQFRTEPQSSLCVGLYASIAEQSARVLKCAQQSQWEQFVVEESELARLIGALDGIDEALDALSEGDVLLRTVYLRQIMDDNAKTHLLVLERTQELERSLTLQSNSQKLERGYGGGAFED